MEHNKCNECGQEKLPGPTPGFEFGLGGGPTAVLSKNRQVTVGEPAFPFRTVIVRHGDKLLVWYERPEEVSW